MLHSMLRLFQDAYILFFDSYNGNTCISIDLWPEIGQNVSKMSLLDHFETAPFWHENMNNTLD
jgi:hypothetical protein